MAPHSCDTLEDVFIPQHDSKDQECKHCPKLLKSVGKLPARPRLQSAGIKGKGVDL
eukprot:CAMPEP_0174385682 /NCGR_PEP_ID=MMETSP0811_2-20130205/126766_1 /TAXON_ID=73025 ORGANISM="Eutreptiella gymnastica-like, Strain CCMP1594" /NCGR_SAMPLE_ID=MMETSP0811_2 /ASSEMBLY_ACC=CAM_ASM_000667 /LENGTH=55 /DNA_ID=CAMNT_0015540091 /DNA_START=849 /DNA_END=1016 /DNA_ORIENTATION=-